MQKRDTRILTDAQLERAEALVEPALDFLRRQDATLGDTLVRYQWRGGPADAVIDALAAYQNEDGGFGRGLEVDIKAPVSNPFATRLAMQVLLVLPDDAGSEMKAAVSRWLVANQDPDGDWHFRPEVLEQEIAPWFAGWTFPSLNPACCLAGLANRLGVATPEMLDRVATLFAQLGTVEEARDGAFYNVLPYVEYVGGVEMPNRGTYLDALAEGIAARDYDDASHFLDHALGGGPGLLSRIPIDRIAREADRLMGEAQDDGGWPTPYNPAWRPWATTGALMTIARLRDGT